MAARIAILSLAVIWPIAARADEPASPIDAFTTPLPQASYVRLDSSYTFDAAGGGETELLARGLVDFHGWLLPGLGPADAVSGLRIDVPIERIATPTAHAFGIGKLALAQLSGMLYSWGSVGAGVTMELPTATNSAFGASDVQVGPAMYGYLSSIPHVPISLLVRTLFATGQSPPIGTALEPIVTVTLSGAFALMSDAQIDIDWLAHEASVPVNLRAGYTFTQHWYIESGPQLMLTGSSRGEVTLDLEVDYLF